MTFTNSNTIFSEYYFLYAKGITIESNKFNAFLGCLSKLRMPATNVTERDGVAKKDDIWFCVTDVV